MMGRLTRAAYLLILVVMIAAYAMQAARSEPEPRKDEPIGRMYS